MSEIKAQLPLALTAEMILYIQSVARYLMEHANGIPHFSATWSYETLWNQLVYTLANPPTGAHTWKPQVHQSRNQKERANARRAKRESKRWGPYARAPRNTKRYAYPQDKAEKFATEIEDLAQCFAALNLNEFDIEALILRFAALNPIEPVKRTGVEITARLFPSSFSPATIQPLGKDMASTSNEVSEDHDTSDSSESCMASSVGSPSEALTASSVTEDAEKEVVMETLGEDKPVTPSEVSEDVIAATPPASEIGSSPAPAMEAQKSSKVPQEAVMEVEMETSGDNVAPGGEVQIPSCIIQEVEEVEEMDTSGNNMPEVAEMEVEIESPGDNKPSAPDNMEGVETTIVTCPDSSMGGMEEEKGDEELSGAQETASTQPEEPRPQVVEPAPKQVDAATTGMKPEEANVVVVNTSKEDVPIIAAPEFNYLKALEANVIELVKAGSERLENMYSASKPHYDVAFLFSREVSPAHHPIILDSLRRRPWVPINGIQDPLRLAYEHLRGAIQNPIPHDLETLVYSIMEARVLEGIKQYRLIEPRKILMARLLRLLARFNFAVFRKCNAPRPMRWDEILLCVQEADTKAWNTARGRDFMYKLQMEGEIAKWSADGVKKRCVEIAKGEEDKRFDALVKSTTKHVVEDSGGKVSCLSQRNLRADVAVFGRRKRYLNSVMLYDEEEIFASGTGADDGDRETRRRKGKAL